MRLAFVVAGILLAGCAGKGYVDVGAGLKEPGKHNGQNPTAILSVGYEFNDKVRCEYWHLSNWLDGWPVDNEPELTVEQIVCYRRVRF